MEPECCHFSQAHESLCAHCCQCWELGCELRYWDVAATMLTVSGCSELLCWVSWAPKVGLFAIVLPQKAASSYRFMSPLPFRGSNFNINQ